MRLNHLIFPFSAILLFTGIVTQKEKPVLSKSATTSVMSSMGRGPDCLGRGLCSVSSGNSAESGSSGGIDSQFHTDRSGNLFLHFDREGMSEEFIAEHFAKNTFVLPEDFSIPSDIASTINYHRRDAKIPAGNYPADIGEQVIIVNFSTH